MPITIADLTSNVSTDVNYVVTGDGHLDDIMETVNAHIDAQFKLGRITGSDYASVYLGAMQAALQSALQFSLTVGKSDAEIDLLAQKAITEFAQTNQVTKVAADPDSIMGKQQTLYGEQAKGFKWNADQKYLKTILDAWSINISTAGIPATGVDAINETGADNINLRITAGEPTG